MPASVRIDGTRIEALHGSRVTVGRGEECDLVVDHAALELTHVTLVRAGDRWTLVCAGDVSVVDAHGERQTFVKLAPGETVWLTPSGPVLELLPGSGAEGGTEADRDELEETVTSHAYAILAPRPSAASGVSRREPEPVRKPIAPDSWVLPLVAAGFALLFAAGYVLWSWVSPDPTNDSGPDAPSVADSSPDVIAPPQPTIDPDRPATPDRNPDPPPKVDPTQAVFEVRVQDAEGTQVYRLGGAWATSDSELLTTAGVSTAIAELRGPLPVVRIAGQDGFESEVTPVAVTDEEGVTARLRVSDPLPVSLPVPKTRPEFRAGQSLTLHALAFDAENEFVVEPGEASKWIAAAVRFTGWLDEGDTDGQTGLFLVALPEAELDRFGDELPAELNLRGGVLVDASGAAVGTLLDEYMSDAVPTPNGVRLFSAEPITRGSIAAEE